MPLWSVGGRQSQRGAVLSQARSDPLLTPCWASLTPLGCSLCCRVRQASGLCAGFAMADFKPMCGERIGLVYHLLFIEHILFLNPTNYIFSRYRLSFLCFATQMHTKQQKQKWQLQWESNSSQQWHSNSYKMQTAVSIQTKGATLYSESNGYGAAGGRSHDIKSRRQSCC